jgi:hypothetical protein
LHEVTLQKIAIAALSVVLSGTTLSAQTERAPLMTDQVRVVLTPPTEPRQQSIHDMMQARDVAGLVRSMLSPIRLPRQLSVEIKSCDGNEDTYYSEGVVTLCYEYVELLQRHSPVVGTPGGVARVDALLGAIMDTLLHEAGHGVFDFLEIPVLGREEDAADFFAAYMALQLRPEDAMRIVEGAAYMFASEARTALFTPFGVGAYAGEHSLAPQRYFNYLCMAYGSNPNMFSNIAMDGGLPLNRFEPCVNEFALLRRGFEKVIGSQMDKDLSDKVRAEIRFQWSPLLFSTRRLDAQPLRDWMSRMGSDDGRPFARRP